MPTTTTLLVITGAPGSGKTRLASEIARRYRVHCLTKDDIKEALFDSLGAGDAANSRRLSDASFAVLFALAARLAAAPGVLLLEGNFRAHEHEAPLARILADRGAALVQVLCSAAAASLGVRLAARGSDPSRHPGHRDAQLALNPAHAAAFLDLPGPRLRFDTDGAGPGALESLIGELERCCPQLQLAAP